MTPPQNRAEFEQNMALGLAPVFAQHFLAQKEVYLRSYALQNPGCNPDELMKFETGDLARMSLENTRNFTVFLANAFADYYYSEPVVPL